MVVQAVRYRWRWAALSALLVAEAMNLLDATVVTVAAPGIHARLGGPASDIQWFTAAYTLPFAVLLLVGGRLGDIAGRRRVFRWGVAGFVLASTACAAAPSAGLLIGARGVQGAAAALIIPQTIGMIRAMFDGDELPAALGTIGPVMGLAAVCGPIVGGVLTHADLLGLAWRPVFLVNVPLGAAVLLAAALLPEDRSPALPRLDVTGAVLAAAATGAVAYPLIENGPLWLLGAGVLLLVGFARHQRGPGTLVETSLFTRPGFGAALVCSLLFFAVVNGLTFVVVLQLELGAHLDARSAGLTLLPWSAAMALASAWAGARLVARFGARLMYAGVAALLVGAAGALAVYRFGPAGRYPWALLVPLGVLGIGQGFFAVPFFTTALHRVRPAETGSAAGLLNAVQQLGGLLGVAVLGTVFLRSAATTGVQHAFWGAVALLVLVCPAVVAMARTPSGA